MMKVGKGFKKTIENKDVSVHLVSDCERGKVLELQIKNTQGATSTINALLMTHTTAAMVHAVLGDMLERLASEANGQQPAELSIDDLEWYPSASGEYCEHDGMTYSYIVRNGFYFVIVKEGVSGTEYNVTDVHTNEQAKHYILKLIKEMKNEH